MSVSIGYGIRSVLFHKVLWSQQNSNKLCQMIGSLVLESSMCKHVNLKNYNHVYNQC